MTTGSGNEKKASVHLQIDQQRRCKECRKCLCAATKYQRIKLLVKVDQQYDTLCVAGGTKLSSVESPLRARTEACRL